jgi:UDP:flavonoid glycosyltransferase YjiC (YdhE family)
VRVLLGCSLGGEGHLVPLTAVGRAIERAGHDVLLVVPPAMGASAERTGLRYRVGDEPPQAVVEEIWQRVRAGPADAVAGLIDRELFADRCTQAMLPAARAAVAEWRPAVAVREPCEYATAVAAYEGDIAQAQVGISLASIESSVREMVAPIIDRFAPGVAAAIGAAPYLSSFPPSLDPSDWPDTRRFRPVETGAPLDGRESWWGDGADPLVYVTFGTVLGPLPEAPATYRCALDAVAGLPVRALLTVGRATDVASLGPVPGNARVERWVPQEAVLRRAALVVCHGGSGTTFGALAAGVPVVICPLFADQSRNGQAVQAAGAGVVLAASDNAAGGLRGLGPGDVLSLRERIEEVLREPAYHEAARRIEAEASGVPSLEEVTERLAQRM